MAQKYTDEIKATAISEWMSGASLDQVAAHAGVAKSTAQGWVKGRTRTNPVRKTESERIDEAYDLDSMAWGLVGDSFSSLRAILRKAQDDSWLAKQDADKLAILFGVTSDKLIRLLAAGTRPTDEALKLGTGRDTEG